MIKTLKKLLKQDKERYSVPRKVQDIIPIQRIWKDGIFQVGNRFSKTYKFTDINYLVASREDKETMFLAYSELLNSLDSGATTKITINNRRLNKANFEQSILMPMRGDSRDVYRKEYNQMLLDKATGANGIIQEKYVTINMSLVGSFAIIITMIARVCLKKAPKIFSYVLWVVAFSRLIIPFSFESVFSIMRHRLLPIKLKRQMM